MKYTENAVIIKRLPAGFTHPQNINLGGHFGIFEDGKLTVTNRDVNELTYVLDACDIPWVLEIDVDAETKKEFTELALEQI